MSKNCCHTRFLEEEKTYEAIIYKDAEDAHWNNNPLALTKEIIEVINQLFLT